MSKTSKIILMVFLVAGGYIRLWIVFQPIEELVYKVIPDDSFYYFQTARHIVAGNGSTFNGTERHNGYHPAWMGIILPIFASVSDDLSLPGSDSALRGALVLGALLDVFAAFLLFQIALRLTGSDVLGILAAALHLFDPYAVFHSVDGLETSLLGVVIVSVLLISREPLSGTPITTRCAVGLGVLLGLLMLARTDAVLFAGPVLLVLLFASDNKQDALKKLVVAGMTASLIVLPWLFWGRWYVGIWGQTSASAAPYELHLAFRRAHGSLAGVPFWRAVKQQLLFGANRALTLSPLGYLLIPLFFGSALLALIRRENARRFMLFISPAIYCFLLLIVHAGWRWMPRPWYCAPLYLFLALLIPVVIGFVAGERRLSRNIFTWTTMIAFAFVFGATGYTTWTESLWPLQKRPFEMASKVRSELAASVRIGHSDAGIMGYFGPPSVANLDGTVSEPARRAIREGRLLDYCLKNDIKLVKIRDGLMLPEVMGERFQLHLYPGPLGYKEIRSDPWGQPERFEAPNGVINLREENASHYFMGGWSVPELQTDPPLVWAVAEKAEVAVTIPNWTKAIEISVMPFHHSKSKYHKMKITIDDITVASNELVPGWQKIYSSVPEDKADDQIHILKFRFDPPPEFTPAELGMWEDYRTLAVAFAQIKIVPQKNTEKEN